MAHRGLIGFAWGVLLVALLVVCGSNIASAQASTAPVIIKVELDESAVLADLGATQDEIGPMPVAAKVKPNELFVRYLPDHQIAEVFLSLMVVAQLEGCPASWAALNQTTADPIPVDSSGRATATIPVQWLFDRQLPTGDGTCWEKERVGQRAQEFSVDLDFSGDEPTVSVGSDAGTVLLGPAIAPTGTGAIDTPEVDASTGDLAAETPSGTEDSDGWSPIMILVLLTLIVTAAAGWLGRGVIQRFFRGSDNDEAAEDLSLQMAGLITDVPIATPPGPFTGQLTIERAGVGGTSTDGLLRLVPPGQYSAGRTAEVEDIDPLMGRAATHTYVAIRTADGVMWVNVKAGTLVRPQNADGDGD